MAGYSGTSLVNKLGIKQSDVMYLSGAPDEYMDWVSPLPEETKLATRPGKDSVNFAHLFATNKKDFQNLFLKVKPMLFKNGMLWVSWPKKASKVPTDLDENIIREFGLKNGLVDVKVCAVSEVWSGLKFVYRVKDR